MDPVHAPGPTPSEIAPAIESALGSGFRLLRPIGEGAVSRVYLMAETALQRLVAVKVMRPELADDAEALHRFSREARAAARIVHPNVVVIHRVGALPENGLPFLVMEFVDGRTLEDVLVADGPMSPDAAREALVGIASALAAAHEKRIVHRDVRAANVMVERGTGRPVLMDFGIAAVMESGSEIATQLTRAGQMLGDPRYLSPERLMGEPPTAEADIFSLGVVGYEILTGEGPFLGESQHEIVAAHMREMPRDLRVIRPGVPPDLAQLLERCLAKKPAHRPAAAEVVRALTAPEGIGQDDHQGAMFPAVSRFLAEVKRRRVYRVAAAYLAGVFLLLQVVPAVLPAIGAPDWISRALVIAGLAGFPVALVLGWIFDITAEGIRRTRHAPDEPAVGTLNRLLPAAALLLSIAIAALLAWAMAT